MMAKHKPPVFDGVILKYPDWKRRWEATVHGSRPEEYNKVWQIIKNIPHRPYIETCTKLSETFPWITKCLL